MLLYLMNLKKNTERVVKINKTLEMTLETEYQIGI